VTRVDGTRKDARAPMKGAYRLWSECRVQGQWVAGRVLGVGGFVSGVGGGVERPTTQRPAHYTHPSCPCHCTLHPDHNLRLAFPWLVSV